LQTTWAGHHGAVAGPTDAVARFHRLQRDRLLPAWQADRPGSTTPRVVVALPSFSLERSVLEHYGARLPPLEHRYLYGILRATDPATRVVFLSSAPVAPVVLEGYLALVPPELRPRVLERTLLASPADVSNRPLAEKVLDLPELIDDVRRFVGDDVALIEPWNVTEAERDLAVALDLPLNGTDPEHWRLATKTESRRLFRRTGVPLPAGVEGVTSVGAVAGAIADLRATHPTLAGVVVKLDASVAGDGNVVLRRDVLDTAGEALDQLVARSLPEWYVDVLQQGGIVEELVDGEGYCSPSGQGVVEPDGSVVVLSTHDQRLGGPNGQVFEGCSFPARDDYAELIAGHVATVGRELRSHGVLGRFSVDFAAVRRDGAWDLRALEINLRKGGTTHTFGLTRLLTGGRYDVDANELRLEDGSGRCYGATDNLVDQTWVGRPPQDVRDRLLRAGLGYDAVARTGVVPHLLDCLEVDGRMGYTAIARTPAEATDLEHRLAAALR
jgi:hypothetical protein